MIRRAERASFAKSPLPAQHSNTAAVATTKHSSKSRKRILIVDDHPMMRQGLAQLIHNEPDIAVQGEAGTAKQALDQVSVHILDHHIQRCMCGDQSADQAMKNMQNALKMWMRLGAPQAEGK